MSPLQIIPVSESVSQGNDQMFAAATVNVSTPAASTDEVEPAMDKETLRKASTIKLISSGN